jgi:hypothetical protein
MIKKDLSGCENMVQNQRTLAAWIAIFFVGMLLIPAATFVSRGDFVLRTVAGNAYVAGFALLTISSAAITGKVKAIGILGIACGGVTMLLALLIRSVESLALTFAGSGILIGGIICIVYASPGMKGGERRKSREFPAARRLSLAVKGLGCMAIILMGANSIPCVHAISAAAAASTSPSCFNVGGITVEALSPTRLNLVYMNNTYELSFSETSVTCNSTTANLPQSGPQTSSMTPSGTVNTFSWDAVQFCYGQYIKYYHADRDYYGISPYTTWSRSGASILHSQTDEMTSQSLVVGGLPLVAGLIGVAIGGLAGAIIALVLLAVIVITGEFVLLDEEQCTWWWVSTAYVQWVLQNVGWLLSLPLAIATFVAMASFISRGYLRIGNTTFFDAIGAGRPAPPYVPPRDDYGSRIHKWPGGSRTCLAR